MEITDIPIENSDKELKTYKKNLKFIENFEGLDSFTDSYKTVDLVEEDVKEAIDDDIDDNSNSEQSCSIVKEVKKNQVKIQENFEQGDSREAGKAVAGLKQAAEGIGQVSGQVKGAMQGVLQSAFSTLSKPEFQEQAKKQIDTYTGLVVDSITRTIANPSHQHKVDEYIIKPFWDLYVIPFIDMYVVFLILYYIIFILTMIWIRKSR